MCVVNDVPLSTTQYAKTTKHNANNCRIIFCNTIRLQIAWDAWKIKKLTAVYIINSALAEFYNYNQQKSKPKFLLQASLVEVPGSWYAANNRHKVYENLNFWTYIQLDNCTYILLQHTVYLLKRKSKFGRILLSFMTYLYCLNPENILRRGLPIVSSCLCGQRGLQGKQLRFFKKIYCPMWLKKMLNN